MNVKNIAADMIKAAASEASQKWKEIKEVAIHEFQMLAKRLASITLAVGKGEMTRKTAQLLFKTARSQLIAVLAMLSTMVAAAAEKIVQAALNVVKTAINTAAGFVLVA